MITVFTPTYNRAHILPQLYESLCKQTCCNFEWLVIDDGSIDNTEQLISTYKNSNNSFSIRYYYQENGGKASAVRKAIQLAHGDFFLFMDSDDYLLDDAICSIFTLLDDIKDNSHICGITGLKVFPDGIPMASLPAAILDMDYLSFRIKYQAGEYAYVVKTSVLLEYPSPQFDGEKFCTEALIFNRIAQKYICRYINIPLQICEYLPGGLSDTYEKNMLDSPNGSLLYWKEMFYSNIPLRIKMSSILSYRNIYKRCDKSKLYKIARPTCLMNVLFPIILLLHKLYVGILK